MNPELESTARALVASGKGILAADESVPTITKRFKALRLDRFLLLSCFIAMRVFEAPTDSS